MAIHARRRLDLLKESVDEFMNDDCPSMAAALSYYTAFSLPPLLILLLVLLGTVFDPGDIRGAIERNIENLMGPAGGEQIRNIIAQAQPPDGSGVLPTLLGLLTLAFGATGFFLQLQSALNRAWEVAPDPKRGTVRQFLAKRIFSFTLILGIAFLLLVSLAVTAALSALSDELGRYISGNASPWLLEALNLLVTLPLVTLLFALMFKFIPDAEVEWHHVRTGAIATAILFMIGKFLIGLYLGRSNPGEPYGAAGAFAVMLVWIYYTAMILLFGAEFTQVYARRHGHEIVPEEGAVRMVIEKRHVDSPRRHRPRRHRPAEPVPSGD